MENLALAPYVSPLVHPVSNPPNPWHSAHVELLGPPPDAELRVYEERDSRRKYAVFAVGVTALLAVAFVASLHWYVLGSILLTLYFNWNPWHYGGQNYGLAVMFLRRRGVPIVGGTKRWLYASFLFSYGLTFCVIHESSLWATARSVPQDPPGLRFVPIGMPASDVLVPVLALGWAVATIGALGMLLPLDLDETGGFTHVLCRVCSAPPGRQISLNL